MFLEMKNITKTFGVVTALDNVSLSVNNGEIHGLLGENGAGKSTLMNILAGVLQPTQGQIFYEDKELTHLTTVKSNACGIRFIHQELNLVNDLKVYENLFLGEEILTKQRTLDRKTMIDKASAVFKRMELDIDPSDMVENLETSRKQLIEIAKALLFDAKLIIMDEPTTALTNKEIEHLFVIMRNLKNEGVSMIYISHKMPELFEICDRYTVLRDGKFIETGNFKDIDEHRATELLVGRSILNEEIIKVDNHGEVLMNIREISSDNYFKNISFDIKKGEVIAITGLHGDGRGELAEALFGSRKLSSGEILIKGEKVVLKNEKVAMKHGISMVQRNRKERSIIPDFSIMDNVSIAYFVNNHRKLLINNSEENERFNRNQKNIGIKVGSPNDYITSLSGGNQQKVIIGRWLELNSDLYILDNPTQGIDVGAKFEIYKIINELANSGKSIIVFSSEFPEIYKVANRCLVMYKGEINAELGRDELTEMKVMYYATGSNLEGLRNE